MSKQDPLRALAQDPQAAALLSDQAALKSLLQSEEAKTLAALLQQMGGQGLGQAAQAAAGGDGAALGSILERVAADPAGARAMETIRKKTGK